MKFHIPPNLISRAIRYITKGPIPAAKDVKIDNFTVGRAHPCFFVAELGINHNGIMDMAKKLIDAAADAGAQAVKFQKRTVPVFYYQEELSRSVPVDRHVLENAISRGVLPENSVKRLLGSDFKDTTRGDYVWAREFTESEYKELFDYAKQKGLVAFASPWDIESVDFMEKLDPPVYKVASASITNHDLLEKIKNTGKPIILSTGMSTMDQVHSAVQKLKTNPLIILHTVSAYPADEKDLNLKLIPKLKKIFPEHPIGYSGHERGISASLAAAVHGAHVIERHITLDKKMFGTDQGTSLEPHEFADLIKHVNTIREATGDGNKRILPSEKVILRKNSNSK